MGETGNNEKGAALEQIEPTDTLRFLFGWLGLVPDPVIEGLTIVAAGYALFLLQRRARRKEMAILVQVIIIKCAAVIQSALLSERESEVSSVETLLHLRQPYDEFGGIFDKTGILGEDLTNQVTFVFTQIHVNLLELEKEFGPIGRNGLQTDDGRNFMELELEAANYLYQKLDLYQELEGRLAQIITDILRITGSKIGEIPREANLWAAKKAQVLEFLEDHGQMEPTSKG